MNKEFWIAKLLPFLDINEDLAKFGEKSYSPKERHEMVLWFEGGLKVSGTQENMSLNLKDPDLMVLMSGLNPIRIFRVPYTRLVGFELILRKRKKEEFVQFFRN